MHEDCMYSVHLLRTVVSSPHLLTPLRIPRADRRQATGPVEAEEKPECGGCSDRRRFGGSGEQRLDNNAARITGTDFIFQQVLLNIVTD